MNDPSQMIRRVAFIGFAVVLLVCIAASFQYRNEILGGFALRGAQTKFEERVRLAVGPDARIEYGESSERSARLLVHVPAATLVDAEAVATTLDDVWVAYAESFAGGGMPVDSIELVPSDPLAEALTSTSSELAARTGVPAPPLHAMYADKGYFDPSQESLPTDDANDANDPGTDPATDEQ